MSCNVCAKVTKQDFGLNDVGGEGGDGCSLTPFLEELAELSTNPPRIGSEISFDFELELVRTGERNDHKMLWKMDKLKNQDLICETGTGSIKSSS